MVREDAWHVIKESIKQNEYVLQQANILARRPEILLSTVAGYHGLAMSVSRYAAEDHTTRSSGW